MTIRVLHVDDEPDIREVAAISLGLDSEFITRSCGSGSEAVAVAAEWPPDIILLDVMMPGMDGPATLARLRASAITASIPVVFMTARAQTRELDLFRSLGAVGVIPKPFDPMTLAASVRSHIEPVDGKLARLQSDFLHRLDNDVARLKKLARDLKTGTARKASLKQIGEIAHGLAGACGVFGFPHLGDLAAELEQTVYDGGVGADHFGNVHRSLDLLLAGVTARDALENLVP
ncbi:response regulator [Rhodopseudomonas palustris]|uniref:response regulator n=1 Tax=Rhodopseudomonas palustris TaxID=1076 RepID=UPI002ACDD049|nr:response regulator [Rhodopseudomonas palustris]WQG99801.1 response regulator [Rhodopseudomonas palustris]